MRNTWALVLLLSAGLHAVAARAADEPPPPPFVPHWYFTPLYSYSTLTGGRPSWQNAGAELLYHASPQWLVGGAFEWLERPPDTDERYTLSASYYPQRTLELRARATLSPSPSFSARADTSVGVDWRALAAWSTQLDYRYQDFPSGVIDQYVPGVTWWANDEGDSSINVRYAIGRAYDAQNFHTLIVRGDVGLPRGYRLVLTYANGGDPEIVPGVPGVILSDAETFAAYVKVPLAPDWKLIAGVEYEDREGLYRRTTGTLGVTRRF